MSVADDLLARLGDVGPTDLAALNTEIEAAQNHLSRLLALRKLLRLSARPEIIRLPVRGQQRREDRPPLPPPEPPASRPPRCASAIETDRPEAVPSRLMDGRTPSPLHAERIAGAMEKRKRLAERLARCGPASVSILSRGCDIPPGTVHDLVAHAWFEKDGPLVSLSTAGHQAVFGKGGEGE